MVRLRRLSPVALLLGVGTMACQFGLETATVSGPLTSGSSEHWNQATSVVQLPHRRLATIGEDSEVQSEVGTTEGQILVHYQRPLVLDDWLYTERREGEANRDWTTHVWGEQAWKWQSSILTPQWQVRTDWKPPRNGSALEGWEPLFQPAVTERLIFLPVGEGGVAAIDRQSGHLVRRLIPVQSPKGLSLFTGPLTANSKGDIYYNIVGLDTTDPWGDRTAGSIRGTGWVVHVRPDLSARVRSLSSLFDGKAQRECPIGFSTTDPRPWPPSIDAASPSVDCGAQRPPMNAAPAVAPDGSVVDISRGSGSIGQRASYIFQTDAGLNFKWATPLAGVLQDGCGVLIPIGQGQLGCRPGTRIGVDPSTNLSPTAEVVDRSTSSPVIAPVGTVLYGAYSRYNDERGHLIELTSSGKIKATYDFGWDTTPAVWPHKGTFSIVTKDNIYRGTVFGDGNRSQSSLVSLDASLKPLWRIAASCEATKCAQRWPEWCITSPAIDAVGNVIATNETGEVVVVAPTGSVRSKIQLDLTEGGRAYAPVVIDDRGRIYVDSGGELVVYGD
jgi:hypothetical protein